jgi:hypothetical protein
MANNQQDNNLAYGDYNAGGNDAGDKGLFGDVTNRLFGKKPKKEQSV